MLLERPTPDFDRFRRAVMRDGVPDRVPLVELYADGEIMAAALGRPEPPWSDSDVAAQRAWARFVVEFFHGMGYDYVQASVSLPLAHRKATVADTAGLSRGNRTWITESAGVIASWEDFERFVWPVPKDIGYAQIERVAEYLPDGMRVTCMSGGVLEWASYILGFQPMCYLIADQPDLVDAVIDRVGETLVEVYRTMAAMPKVGACWMGDDLGHKTGTLVSPRFLREKIFPWHRRISETIHAAGMPYVFHCCGNIREIMPDLIDTVGIDARHSFEDIIEPVIEAKERWGDRVGILGGIDVDFLCRASEDDVRAHTRRVLESCAPGGGYALGTGNSVANYVPLRNYFAMVDEGRRFRM